jgi:3-methyladenine DNA glycosylase AlkD
VKLPTLRSRLRRLGDRKRARVAQRYFKTGPGEYGEGDVFIGVAVPPLRRLARDAAAAARVTDALKLLKSRIHEERLLALLLLVRHYEKGDGATRSHVYRNYLANTRRINNWDLVDLSAPNIVGAHLLERSRTPLYRLAKSKNVWERRIAILATFRFIRERDFADTLKIARTLLADEHCLIHKAAGWMLREVGKRDRATAERFLTRHCRTMPRTMLRYAIERFPERKRRQYLDCRKKPK